MKALNRSSRVVFVTLLGLLALATLLVYGMVTGRARASEPAEIVADAAWSMTVVVEREIAFVVPAGWAEASDRLAWSDGSQEVGLNYDRVRPRWQPDYVLPADATVVRETKVKLPWGEATRFVTRTAARNQVHLVVVVDDHIYAFYATGADVNKLSDLLDKMAASAVRADSSPRSVAVFGGVT